MEVYGKVYRDVAPKQAAVTEAMQILKKKQDDLRAAKEKLKELTDTMFELKKEHDEKSEQRDRLKRQAEETEAKLIRADKLVNGLAGERERWQDTIVQYEEQMELLVGDCVVAAAFLSYAGPFTSLYRDELVNATWLKEVRRLKVGRGARRARARARGRVSLVALVVTLPPPPPIWCRCPVRQPLRL